MKYSYKLSDAIHLLSYLEINKDGNLSSKAIAASIDTNPSIIRQFMSSLRSAGIIDTQKGIAAPRLAMEAKEISIYDIYQAIETDQVLLHLDPKTNKNDVVGAHIQDSLTHFYSEIEDFAYLRMRQITLADVIHDLRSREKVDQKKD